MKNIFSKISIVFFLIIAISCGDAVTDLGVDPDAITSANDSEVLTSAQGYIAIVQDADLNPFSFLWAQYYTWGLGVSLGNAERFVAEPDDHDNKWRRIWANALADINYLKKSDEAEYRGIANILNAYVFQMLVDHFGDIPYQEAVQGAIEDGGITSPNFDNAATIYGLLVEEIDAGLAELEGPEVNGVVGTDDLLFAGNIDQWIRFGNSLKLRILMRTAEVDAKSAEVVDLIANGTFLESTADVAEVNWNGSPGNENPMYSTQISGVGDFYFPSNATVNVLTNLGDPRLNFFYGVATAGPFAGTIRGIDQGTVDFEPFTADPAEYSGSSAYANGPTVSTIFMSPWEVWFLRAEADLRYNTADDAETALGTAIQSNFTHVGAGSAAAYTASLNYAGAASDDARLDIIGIQKWISFNGTQEDEGWIEARRFDRPSSRLFTNGIWQTPPFSQLGAGEFPAAWLYPQSELATNGSPTTPTQRVLTDRIFWDN